MNQDSHLKKPSNRTVIAHLQDAIYLQVLGDRVGGSVCYQENCIGFADHPVPHFNVTSMPVGQPCPHHSHAQLGIVMVVELPAEAQEEIMTHRTNLPYILQHRRTTKALLTVIVDWMQSSITWKSAMSNLLDWVGCGCVCGQPS